MRSIPSEVRTVISFERSLVMLIQRRLTKGKSIITYTAGLQFDWIGFDCFLYAINLLNTISQTGILSLMVSELCGQSYKASTIVIYDSRVVPDLKIPHITTLES